MPEQIAASDPAWDTPRFVGLNSRRCPKAQKSPRRNSGADARDSPVVVEFISYGINEDFKNYVNTYYFPAYEITKEYFVDPFKEDNRHLKDQHIKEIMEIFLKYYCV